MNRLLLMGLLAVISLVVASCGGKSDGCQYTADDLQCKLALPSSQVQDAVGALDRELDTTEAENLTLQKFGHPGLPMFLLEKGKQQQFIAPWAEGTWCQDFDSGKQLCIHYLTWTANSVVQGKELLRRETHLSPPPEMKSSPFRGAGDSFLIEGTRGETAFSRLVIFVDQRIYVAEYRYPTDVSEEAKGAIRHSLSTILDPNSQIR